MGDLPIESIEADDELVDEALPWISADLLHDHTEVELDEEPGDEAGAGFALALPPADDTEEDSLSSDDDLSEIAARLPIAHSNSGTAGTEEAEDDGPDGTGEDFDLTIGIGFAADDAEGSDADAEALEHTFGDQDRYDLTDENDG